MQTFDMPPIPDAGHPATVEPLMTKRIKRRRMKEDRTVGVKAVTPALRRMRTVHKIMRERIKGNKGKRKGRKRKKGKKEKREKKGKKGKKEKIVPNNGPKSVSVEIE